VNGHRWPPGIRDLAAQPLAFRAKLEERQGLERISADPWAAERAVGYRAYAITRKFADRVSAVHRWPKPISSYGGLTLDQPTPPGYGIPDGAGNAGST
jgi:hypothetical protein